MNTERSCAECLRFEVGGFLQPSGIQQFYFKSGFLFIFQLISLFLCKFTGCKKILEQYSTSIYAVYVHFILKYIMIGSEKCATELSCKTIPVLLYRTYDNFEWYEVLIGIKSL